MLHVLAWQTLNYLKKTCLLNQFMNHTKNDAVLAYSKPNLINKNVRGSRLISKIEMSKVKNTHEDASIRGYYTSCL